MLYRWGLEANTPGMEVRNGTSGINLRRLTRFESLSAAEEN
jgi:hypothetical protein